MRITIITAALLAFSLFSCQQGNDKMGTAQANAAISCTEPQQQTQSPAETTASDIVFQSLDGGKTWQDVSKGLPEKFGLSKGFVQNGDLFLVSYDSGIYHSSITKLVPAWEKEVYLNEPIDNVFPIASGPVVSNTENVFFQELLGTGAWLSTFHSLKDKMVRCMYESKNALFVGCDNGIFRSTDGGTTWTQVLKEYFVTQIMASGERLFSNGRKGIFVSSDGGDTWTPALPQEGIVFNMGTTPEGLFAIMDKSPKPMQRLNQLYTSSDNGSTWKAMSKEQMPFESTSAYAAVGKNMVCSHEGGISTSNDGGKTWTLSYKVVGENTWFDFIVADGIIYALKRSGGC